MKLRLLGKRLLVREIPEKPDSLLHIPEKILKHYLDRPTLYRVIDVGTKPVEPKIGDRVLCHSHEVGPEQLDNGYAIVTEEQVVLILPRKENS